jgi:hypothetical protein
MFENADELCSLDTLLGASFERAGAYLVGIISPDRRLWAADLTRYLVGVRHLVVATVTAKGEPRCSAVEAFQRKRHRRLTSLLTELTLTRKLSRPSL